MSEIILKIVERSRLVFALIGTVVIFFLIKVILTSQFIKQLTLAGEL